MQKKEINNIVEALLFASPEPLTQAQLNSIIEPDLVDPELTKLENIIEDLQNKYLENDNAFTIVQVAAGYQIVSRSEYEIFIRRLLKKSGRLALTNASLETLAIVAYRQPVNRFEIESIRGVDSSGVLKTLLSKNLIKIKGRDLGPGRPLLYNTTEKYLEYFGLSNLSEMPKLSELAELEKSESSQDNQTDAFE
ncbi:MAG: SMC-Scp complex subunit ScpB [Candidatus Marinimicrobia bacterium]|nr:SMC-Scp complex subunit ScpB [Candidatus Neomarinimicrobiota bacterium]